MDRREFLKKSTAAAGLTTSPRLTLSSAAPIKGAGLETTEAAGSSLLCHDYDPISDRVTFRIIDHSHRSLGQSFTVPSGAKEISGFRMKIRRLGETPDLCYKIGGSFGADDIISGTIVASKVNPFFEFFYGDDFLPKSCRPGQKYFIQLFLCEPSIVGGFEVYGTQVEYEGYGITVENENPANLDYGARTPSYVGGDAFDSAGQPIRGVSFAFKLFFGPTTTRKLNGEVEPRWEFVNELMRGPHTYTIRDRNVTAKQDEILIDDSWKIVWVAGDSEISQTALADFRQFLNVCMEVRPSSETVDKLNKPMADKGLIVGTRREMPSFGRELRSSESYRIQVSGAHVTVCGLDERGLMRGLIYLEDLMSFKKAPALPRMDVIRSPRYTPRITCLPFYAGMELDSPTVPYTDEILSFITHYGFNAIWIQGKLHDLGTSSMFPELGKGADLKIRQLNGIINRARQYSLDVYLYLVKYELPVEFFDSHPEVRGSQSFFKTGYSMCTSVPEAQQYIHEAVQSIFKSAPGLKGIIFIIGGEGFIHCWSRRHAADCPRCRNRGPIDVVAEVIEVVNNGAKSGKPDADVVVWTYGASGTWSQGDDPQARLIQRLPNDVIFLSDFSKGGHIKIGEVEERVYDYSISFLGPSEKFCEQVQLCSERGVRTWAKTECMISLEFIQAPYIPVYQRWTERYKQINSFPEVQGLFMNWNHYGFMPSRVLELAKWYTFTPLPEAVTLLTQLATRDFGAEAASDVLRAWRHFSTAITHYPFSGYVALGPIQSGPALPLFFDPDYQVHHRGTRRFSNDLLWTVPWGPELCSRSLRMLEAEWSRGVECLSRLVGKGTSGGNREIVRELGVAHALLCCVRSALNQIEFDRMRVELMEQGYHPRNLALLSQMKGVARQEIRNSTEALKWVSADSRLGYCNGSGITSGGSRAGIYTPQMVEKKLFALRRMLEQTSYTLERPDEKV